MRLATRHGNVAAIGLLVYCGANVGTKAKDGETPLTRAARLRNIDAVRFLLDHGALTTAKKEPLMLGSIASTDQTEIAKLLRKHGVEVVVRSSTPVKRDVSMPQGNGNKSSSSRKRN